MPNRGYGYGNGYYRPPTDGATTTSIATPSTSDWTVTVGPVDLPEPEELFEGYRLMVQERERITRSIRVQHPFFTPAPDDRCVLMVSEFCGEVDRRFQGHRVKKHRFVVRVWAPQIQGTETGSWGPYLTWDCSRTVFLSLCRVLENPEDSCILHFRREGGGLRTRYHLSFVARGADLDYFPCTLRGQAGDSPEVEVEVVDNGPTPAEPPERAVWVEQARGITVENCQVSRVSRIGQNQSLEEEFFARVSEQTNEATD